MTAAPPAATAIEAPKVKRAAAVPSVRAGPSASARRPVAAPQRKSKLLRVTAGRNTDVIAAALREHSAQLAAFVRARVPAEEVDDLLQGVALRAIERAESLREPDKVLAWLFRLHRNAIVDATRRRARRQITDQVAELLCEDPNADDRCACSVVQAQSLGATYSEVLALVDVEGLTLAEAAEALGTTVNAATVRLHRARKALRQRLLDHCGVTSVDECSDCRCTYDGCCSA